jgi:hypothetical protein
MAPVLGKRDRARAVLGKPGRRRGRSLPKTPPPGGPPGGRGPGLPKTGRPAADSKPEVPSRATLRLELVLCGKAKCKRLHGPYWYAYWQVGRGTRKVYVGKSLPADLAERRLRARSRRRCRGSAHDAKVLEVVELGSEDE